MDDNRQQMIAQIKALKELQRRRATETVNHCVVGFYIYEKYNENDIV